MIPRRVFITVLLVGLLATAACRGGGDDAETVDDPDSPYCRLAVEWAVHEMDPRHDDDPSWLRTYVDEYVAFATDSAELAPAEVAVETEMTLSNFVDTIVPLLERYDYSMARIAAEASPEEQAASEPPPDVAAGQARVLDYDSRVCATQWPSTDGVAFEGPASDQYCDAARAVDDAFVEAGTDPAAVRELLTSDELDGLMTAAAAVAPDEISDDVATFAAFFDERVRPIVASFDYDLRRLILEGTAADRAAVNSTDPAVREAYVRTTAYLEQLCS